MEEINDDNKFQIITDCLVRSDVISLRRYSSDLYNISNGIHPSDEMIDLLLKIGAGNIVDHIGFESIIKLPEIKRIY